MNREEFNNLSVLQQAEYFNNELKNNNFNAICKKIGVSKNTIKKRFSNNKFIEKKEGQIIKEFIVQQEITQEKIEKVVVAPKEKKSKKVNLNIDLDVIKRIEILEKQMIKIKSNMNITEVIKDNSNTNITEVIQHFEGETVVKTFKIDKEVNSKLENLQNKYKGYKKQDLVSSLLKYALEKLDK